MISSNDTEIDIAVIGAGAAGMIAAAQAARGGARVAVFEKANKAGVKILMSGGTRCNITHDCDAAGIRTAFGNNGRFLRQALAEFGPRDVVAMFERLGVPSKVEPGGKVFPVSDRALDVCQALVNQMKDLGVTLHLASAVSRFRPEAGGFVVHVDTRDGAHAINVPTVIVTVGGQSYPGCGTTGDGYAWLELLGHRIVPPRPALVPIVGGVDWSRELQGLTLPEASVSVHQIGVPAKKSTLATRTGGLLFTHFGFSGPAAMDVSRSVSEQTDMKRIELRINALPGWNQAKVWEYFEQQRASDGKRHTVRVIPPSVPRRLAEALAHQSAIDSMLPIAQLNKTQRNALTDNLLAMRFPVQGTRGFPKAEVTAGGVALDQIDPRTMQSRIVPGLFVAGELLDLDAWIGGYNFQSAFSTGYVAGRCAAMRIGSIKSSG